MSEKSVKVVPIFEVEKKNSRKKYLLRKIEMVLIFIAVLGTAVWMLFNNHFSFPKLLFGIEGALKPQISSQSSQAHLSPKEKIESLINTNKIVDIASTNQTPEGNLEFQTKQGLTIFFDKGKNPDEQVATLQTLLSKAKIENKNPKKIDFRFAKIVVEY